MYCTQHAILPEIGGKWTTECLNTICPLLNLLCAGCRQVQNSTPRFASTPERRNGNVNLNKYSSPRAGNEPTTSRFYSHTLCHCATTGLMIYCIIFVTRSSGEADSRAYPRRERVSASGVAALALRSLRAPRRLRARLCLCSLPQVYEPYLYCIQILYTFHNLFFYCSNLTHVYT